MHLTRSLLLAGACLGFAASAAQALGFGPPPAGVALGSPLDFVLPVRLDAGEELDPECLSAELQIGDRRVPSYNLRWAVEPGTQPGERRIRVVSLVVVDEPVITLQVNTGCTARISRRFTVLADPPLGQSTPQAPALAAAPSPAAAVQSSPSMPPAARAPGRTASTPEPERAASPATAPSVRTPRTPRRATAQSVRPSRPRAAAAVPRARLSLEAPDPTLVQQAVAAALAQQQASAAQAAESARVAQEAASAAAARVQALEQQLQRVQAEARQQQEQLQQLRAQAGREQQAARWLPWLGTALFVALAAVGWLVWRLQQARRESHSKWWADAAAVLADARPDQGPAPTPAVSAPPALPADRAGAGTATLPLATAAHEAEAALEAAATGADPLAGLGLAAAGGDTLQAAVAAEPAWTRTGPPPRPVSVEELIDLEQQAEFFVVLGQDEEAIDLLVSHLRDSGGTSPLPYLKLLEIYRRQGDREAYERTRTRFNQRFNAYAPEWDADMQHGRALEDYPQVMQRLQQAWGSPIDAMAALETLLFRKDGGELFELPAYREVLLLYSLARELLDQHPGTGRAEVDVLLPLDLALEAVPESAGERTLVLTPDVQREPPTRFDAVDLDLTRPDEPPAAGRHAG